MKKILLGAAFAACAGVMNADDVVNMVVNGNFEAPYEQEIPGGYGDWYHEAQASLITGWNWSTGGEWNGTVCILTGEDWAGDGELRPEDDLNVLHLNGYAGNGWTKVSAYQVVENLVPGREYTLDFLCAVELCDGAWDNSHGVVISETDVNADGATIAGKKITEMINPEEAYSEFEQVYTLKFAAPANGKIFLNFFLMNGYGDWWAGDKWMNIDLVRVYSAEGDEVPPTSAVKAIENENAPVEYYNLQGVRVANPENGIFVRRQGNKTTKVVL